MRPVATRLAVVLLAYPLAWLGSDCRTSGVALADTTRYNVPMIPTLSDELQHALDQSAGQPIRVEDPRTRKAYVLVEWHVARTWLETHREVDGDWSETKNARRCELIRKKFADGLTPAETAELGQLQEQVGQFREQFGPLAADTVRALEAELQRIRGRQPDNGGSG